MTSTHGLRNPDHPRACGENLLRSCLSCLQDGSPPRMRGKRSVPGTVRREPRITPAHAGKTHSRSASVSASADHPRACGENTIQGRERLPFSGSPPRMRGKRPLTITPFSVYRITPAHAGKTQQRGSADGGGADHPRACGENSTLPSLPCSLFGSPPRMRGKRDRQAEIRNPCRITPAHAGKTDGGSVAEKRYTDHPRACGENRVRCTQLKNNVGSPPRMRGKQRFERWVFDEVRITPAHAGKTIRRGNQM